MRSKPFSQTQDPVRTTAIERQGPNHWRVGERVYRNRDYAERAHRRSRLRKRAILNAILNHRSIATAILVAKLRPWEA